MLRSTFWTQLSASLDAVSYIIALGVVDLITFGRPVNAEPKRDGYEGHGYGGALYGLPDGAGTSSSPPPSSTSLSKWSVKSAPRRSASDPGNGMFTTSAKTSAQDRVHAKRTSGGGWQQRRSGSLDQQSIDPIEEDRRNRGAHQRRPSYSNDGTLHHYQRKLFSKEMQRTMRLQPYVRASIILSFIASWVTFSFLLVLVLAHGGIRPAFGVIVSRLL